MIPDKPLTSEERAVFNQYLADDARETRNRRETQPTPQQRGRFYATLILASIGVWAVLIIGLVNLAAAILR